MAQVIQNVMLATDQAFTPPVVLSAVDSLAKIAALTPAEIRLFLSLLLAYPVALTWRALPPGPSGTFRHIFSVVVGGWMLQFVSGYQWLLNIGSCLFCYGLMWALGPNSARTVSFVAMAILASGHLYRQITDYLGWTLDWTLVAMVTTQKVMGLAYNVQDGTDPNATKEQRMRSVNRLPSVLEFLSFILFPANITIGPGFEYADYKGFAEGTMVAPSPYLPGLWRLAQGLFYIVAHLVLVAKFPAVALITSNEFHQSGTLLSRFATICLGFLGMRCKYYFGWKIAEGSACMSGLGYNGTDKVTGAHKWDRMENVNVWEYELSQSLRMSSQSWNKTTNLWLRRYVYDRAPPALSLYFTYLVSAIWHGFYPGYYMFFLIIAAATVVHRKFRRTVRPLFMASDGKTAGPLKPLYDLFSIIATFVTLNYFVMSFILLAFDKSVDAFRRFGFIGHWALIAALLVFGTGLIRPPRKKVSAKEN